MASAARRNKSAYKSRSTKSMNAFAAFDQLQIQEFKEAFNLIDQDKDGIISKQDLKQMFASLGKIENQDIINEMLGECTGPLNFTMFLSLFADKYGSTDPENVVLNAFSMFDPDETGKIRCRTLRHLLTTCGDRFTQEEVDDLFSNVLPMSTDTYMDYREFSKMLKHGDKNDHDI